MDSIFISVLKEFGPFVALVAYYVWRDFLTAKQAVLREGRMTDRIQALEDYQRGELAKMAGEAIRQQAATTSALEQFVETVKTRPCLLHEHSRTSVGR